MLLDEFEIFPERKFKRQASAFCLEGARSVRYLAQRPKWDAAKRDELLGGVGAC